MQSFLFIDLPEALKFMLNLNEPLSMNEVREPIWKVCWLFSIEAS